MIAHLFSDGQMKMPAKIALKMRSFMQDLPVKMEQHSLDMMKHQIAKFLMELNRIILDSTRHMMIHITMKVINMT